MSNNQDPPIVIPGGQTQSSVSVPGPILNGVLWQLNGAVPPDPPIIISGGNSEL